MMFAKSYIVLSLTLTVFGCHYKHQSQSEVFKMKQECSAKRDKLDEGALARSNVTHNVEIYSVFYSQNLNSCLVAEKELFMGEQAAMYLSIKDLSTQDSVWSKKDTGDMEWPTTLKRKIAEYQ